MEALAVGTYTDGFVGSLGTPREKMKSWKYITDFSTQHLIHTRPSGTPIAACEDRGNKDTHPHAAVQDGHTGVDQLGPWECRHLSTRGRPGRPPILPCRTSDLIGYTLRVNTHGTTTEDTRRKHSQAIRDICTPKAPIDSQ
jgi:hypothetical protein